MSHDGAEMDSASAAARDKSVCGVERWYIAEVFVDGKWHVVWDRIRTRVKLFSTTAVIILT
jgi:hypothetical protein